MMHPFSIKKIVTVATALLAFHLSTAQTFQVFKGDTINRISKNGKQEGIWRKYYKNDSLFSEGSYKNGIRVGVHRTFYMNGKPQAGPDRIARHAGRAITTVYKSMSDCVMRRRPLHGFKVAANLRAEVDSSYNGRSGRYASPARASDCSKSRAEQPSMNAANDILPKA